MRNQLRIDFLNHGNPHRTTATRKLIIFLGLDVFVEFKRFFQRENIREQRDFHHAGKADFLKCRAEFSGRDCLGILVDKRGRNHCVNRGIRVSQRVECRQNVAAFGELLCVATANTFAATDAKLRVDRNGAVFDKQRVKIAARAALFQLCILACAGIRANHDRMFFRPEQAGKMVRIITLLLDKVKFFGKVA
ncbi:hypothetical protein SDC9_162675 [bioreactor metagenome]|uniref:Uncharacterized protein n=1 Tax=bioreactor metagenome TaxID=1076179 RepID=A0A645FTI8_9ZZZZ